MRYDHRSAKAMAKIVELLSEHSMTINDICETLNISRTAAYKYVARLRVPENRQLRICAWDLEGTRYVAFYRVGTRADTKYPGPMNRAELRIRSLAKKPKAAHDPLLAWIPKPGEKNE